MHQEEQFIRKIESLSYGLNTLTLFQDFIEIAALSLHQQPYHCGLVRKDEEYEKIEAEYMERICKYKPEVRNSFPELIALVHIALAEKPQDFLGSVYMKLEVANKRNGEFFTPYHISKMMACMVLGDVATLIKEKGYFTMCEPACGAGGMVIAAADIVRESGFCATDSMTFAATDINRICFNMTYIQSSLLQLTGIVVHGNTLSMEAFDVRETPYHKIKSSASGRLFTAEEKKIVAAEVLSQAQTYQANKKGQYQLF